MNIKKIFIIANSFFPLTNAEANRMTNFAKYLYEKKYSVTVITQSDLDKVENAFDGIEIIGLRNKFLNKKNTIARALKCFTFLFKTNKWIARHKKSFANSYTLVTSPELIPCMSGMKAKKFGSKLIFDVRDIWPEVAFEMGALKRKSLIAIAFKKISKKLYLKSSYIITVSERKREYLSSLYGEKLKNKVFLVHNGFDLELLNVEKDFDFLKKINIEGKFVVSYVGKIGEAQNVLLLLKIAEECKMNQNIIFLIAGEGTRLDECKKFADSHKLSNVDFLGYLNKKETMSLNSITNLSFVTLRSSKMKDSVPTKLFESLGFGIPVILSASGESADILSESKLGISISPDSDYSNLKDIFFNIYHNYDRIIKNKDYCQNYIKEKWSRQSACESLYCLLEENVNE